MVRHVASKPPAFGGEFPEVRGVELVSHAGIDSCSENSCLATFMESRVPSHAGFHRVFLRSMNRGALVGLTQCGHQQILCQPQDGHERIERTYKDG